MTFNLDNKENQIGTLAYEKPSLKRYGTMKELTFQNGGSDGGGGFQGGQLPQDLKKELKDDKLESNEWYV